MIRSVIFVLAAALGSRALAQDVPSITPSTFRAAAGTSISLNLANATTGAPLNKWDDTRISWTLIRVAGTQRNSDLAPRADEKAEPGSVKIDTPGDAIIGVDFKPRAVTLA